MTVIYRPVPGYDDLYAGMDASIVLAGVGELEQKAYGNSKYLAVSIPKAGIRHVHTLMATAYLGPKPKGYHTRHGPLGKLENRIENLCYGTNGDNQRDSVREGTHRNTSKTQCSQGHDYTPENTYIAPSGGRQCRKCRYISNQNGLPPMVRGRHASPEQIQEIIASANLTVSNREIARMVGVSPQTVARHRPAKSRKRS